MMLILMELEQLFLMMLIFLVELIKHALTLIISACFLKVHNLLCIMEVDFVEVVSGHLVHLLLIGLLLLVALDRIIIFVIYMMIWE